jgi:hypothetical protein
MYCSRSWLLCLRKEHSSKCWSLHVQAGPVRPQTWRDSKISSVFPALSNYALLLSCVAHSQNCVHCALYTSLCCPSVYIYRVAQKSDDCLVKCVLKYVTNSFTTLYIKKCSKLNPPCSVHNSERCDTGLQSTDRFKSEHSR